MCVHATQVIILRVSVQQHIIIFFAIVFIISTPKLIKFSFFSSLFFSFSFCFIYKNFNSYFWNWNKQKSKSIWLNGVNSRRRMVVNVQLDVYHHGRNTKIHPKFMTLCVSVMLSWISMYKRMMPTFVTWPMHWHRKSKTKSVNLIDQIIPCTERVLFWALMFINFGWWFCS